MRYKEPPKQTGPDESTLSNMSADVMKHQCSGGRWDDHKLPVVWLFVVTVSVFGFTALQNLIWFTRTMTIMVTVSALVFPSASIIRHTS